MRTSYLLTAIIISLLSCQQEPEPYAIPEKGGWYVLQSPTNQPIYAVLGNIDSTLLLSTLSNEIYYTTDKGKSWQMATFNQPNPEGIMGFAARKDTIWAMTSARGGEDGTFTFFDNPVFYSLDSGRSWKHKYRIGEIRTRYKVATSPSGIQYTVEESSTPYAKDPQNALLQETTGIAATDGRLLPLPDRHQTKGLYLDSQQRLYVCNSAPVCGPKNDAKFCGTDENSRYRGVLYISKQPQP
ncbi:hypothetical protein J2I47_26285 [Fibrella sp. HMF5335]|uniref:Uncharacterized protein n=1 Tax=Fibrella rubiginis TaxID=2817060 RepID=A0A939GKN7_9BACT|nr:hypothetical protein [Fibrella rubiginis]MBO0940081.1 hypothetical protein [Fibrella rubiginis]